MVFKYILVTVLSFVTLTTAVYAQNKSDTDRLFRDYITQNKFYMSQIALKADRVFALTYPTCDKPIQTTRLTPIVIIPRVFEKPKYEVDEKKIYEFSTINPSHGQWVERALLNACGKVAQINLLVTAYDLNKIPEIYPLMNGQTKVEIIDQSKAEEIVKAEVKAGTKCQNNSFVVDTKFMGFRDPESNSVLSKTDKNVGWVEQWTVNACDSDHIVNFAVLPDPRTRYRYVAKIKSN